MAKILLTMAGFLILPFILFAMMCAVMVAGRSDKHENNSDNNEGDDDGMFWKRKLCPRCKVGKWSYELDKHSEVCPYFECWKNGNCRFYEPLDKESKKGIFGSLKNKQSVTHEKFKACALF